MEQFTPKKKLGYDSEFFVLKKRGKTQNFSAKTPKENKLAKEENRFLFTEKRFHAFTPYLLAGIALFYITNILLHFNTNIGANLSHVSSQEQLRVINPLPDFDAEYPIIINPIKAYQSKEIEAEWTFRSFAEPELMPFDIELKSINADFAIDSNELKAKLLPRKKVSIKTTAFAAPEPKVAAPAATTTFRRTATPKRILKKSLPQPAQPSSITWNSVRQKAIKEQKSSFILFGASYCLPCRMMQDVMRTHQNVKGFIDENYLYHYVDIQSPEGKWLQLEHNITMLPTMIFFDSQGNKTARYDQAFSSKDLLNVLQTHQNKTSILAQTKDTTPTFPHSKSEKREKTIHAIIADIQTEFLQENIGREK